MPSRQFPPLGGTASLSCPTLLGEGREKERETLDELVNKHTHMRIAQLTLVRLSLDPILTHKEKHLMCDRMSASTINKGICSDIFMEHFTVHRRVLTKWAILVLISVFIFLMHTQASKQTHTNQYQDIIH